MKKEIQTKLVSRKTNAAKGDANWKFQPLSNESYHNIVKILNDPSRGKISNS